MQAPKQIFRQLVFHFRSFLWQRVVTELMEGEGRWQ